MYLYIPIISPVKHGHSFKLLGSCPLNIEAICWVYPLFSFKPKHDCSEVIAATRFYTQDVCFSSQYYSQFLIYW